MNAIKQPFSHVPLKTVVDACEYMLSEYGSISYAAVARSLSCSRQNIQNKIQRAYESGKLTTEQYNRLQPGRTRRTQRTISLHPEVLQYLEQQAAEASVSVSTFVELAVRQLQRTKQDA